jgi:two-component system chemotaxis sensor kinase CheA
VDEEFLALFLSEARERVGAIETTLAAGPLDAEGAARVRRDLHALKGASRMLGLADLASAVHRGEDALEPFDASSAGAVIAILDEIVSMVNALDPERTGAGGAEAEGERTAPVSPPVEDEEVVRLRPAELDLLSDSGAKMRVVASAAEQLIGGLYQLSHAAEGGVTDRHPDQILATLAVRLRNLALEAERGQRAMDRLITRQLDMLLGIQMQPVEPLFLQLGRHIRELAASLGRDVQVEIQAESCNLDRRIVRALRESLVHLVRNAVDHGIEPPVDRIAAGKPAIGTIVLRAEQIGQRLRIEVRDDGSGVSRDAVFAAAERRGLADRLHDDMPDEAVVQLLFTPGFSTASTTTQISGRGVGLDAVAAAVKRVGGEVWLRSVPGEGACFTLDIPIAQRGERVVIVGVGGARIGVPEAGVRRYGHPATGDDPPSETPSVALADLLGIPSGGSGVSLELERGGSDVVLVVDEVVAEEEVFVRPLPAALGPSSLYSGLALRPGGQPVAILDPGVLIAFLGEPGARAVDSVPDSPPMRILLIDDSRVTRTMLRRYLVDEGFDVVAAGTGVEGWGHLLEGGFDCLVTDIEMPEMSGLELTRRVRGHDEFGDLPIVVVSTRDRTEDRMAGLEAGADAYVAKQRLDSQDLAVTIRRLGGLG